MGQPEHKIPDRCTLPLHITAPKTNMLKFLFVLFVILSMCVPSIEAKGGGGGQACATNCNIQPSILLSYCASDKTIATLQLTAGSLFDAVKCKSTIDMNCDNYANTQSGGASGQGNYGGS